MSQVRIHKQHHFETAHRDQLFTQTYSIDEELIILSESTMELVCVNRKLDGKAVSCVAVDTHLAHHRHVSASTAS